MNDPRFDVAEIREKSVEFERSEPVEILRWCWRRYGERAAIGTSFQGAGLVVMDLAFSNGMGFPVFTIDTGLLFPETLELKGEIERRYGIEIESLKPEQTVAEQAAEHGEALWNRNPDLCCTLRKVLPLQKKLAALDVWITGLRRDQSETRRNTGVIELYRFDVLRDRYILKLNPLAGWSREMVSAYIEGAGLPKNKLAELGYRSIGCQPCTRPVGANDDERAGRWVGFDKRECGIHTFLGASI